MPLTDLSPEVPFIITGSFECSLNALKFSRIIVPLCCLVAQLFPSLCNLMGCIPPGSSVHGIFQARILEWVAISSFRELS